MARLTPDGDSDLPGNLYARKPDGDDLSEAILAVAFELRTANMIAARALSEEDREALALRLEPPAEWDWTLRRYSGKDDWFLESEGTRSARGEIVLRALTGCTFGDLGDTWSQEEVSSTQMIYVGALPLQVTDDDEVRLTVGCLPFTSRDVPSTPFGPVPVRLDRRPSH
jgi:hypothetical protein